MRFIALFIAFVMAFAPPVFAEQGFADNVKLTDGTKNVPDNAIIYGDGRTGSLNEYRGEVLVVTMWQISCPFCRKEMPVLDRLAADMGDEGIRILPLGLDQDMGAITAHLDRMGWPNLKPIQDVDMLNGLIMSVEHFGRMGVVTPTSFIVGKDGKVVATVFGLVDWDGEPARGYLRSLAAS